MKRQSAIGAVALVVATGLLFGDPPGGSLQLREMEAAPRPKAPAARAPAGGSGDCNGNGVPDETDIATGTSADCNANTIPDECDTEPQFVTHTITAAAIRAQSIVAVDVDGDGDPDVAAAHAEGDAFAWYENTDGAGTFGVASTIGTGADFAVSISPVDVDSDSDVDFVTASALDDTVAWYENTDGAGTFGPRRIISTTALLAWAVIGADLDSDGDPDVVSASQSDSTIAWYENTDGAGTFGPRRIVSTLADIPVALFATDVDGDADLDLLSASDGDDKIAWYENTDGLGAFGHQQVITLLADDASSVHAADLDGDGDPDVLSASFVDEEIAWYEKLDGQDGFGPQQLISQNARFALDVFAADLDGDGDPDVLSASGGDDKIAWYENTDGAGAFGPERPIALDANGAGSVDAADLDGDGDLDVLSASETDNRLAWYENVGDDCNGNAVPDACEPDCNANGRADACDLALGASPDCNANAVPDDCDVALGTSPDCAGNGVPDECEPDCNLNLSADSCDLDLGTSLDCTGNGVPDECEPDCNLNLSADSCDLDLGTSLDCTGNGVPDECEPDCNLNLSADSCDLNLGTSPDCNGNAVPDECDALSGGGADCDADGVLDACETRVTFAMHVLTTAADFTRSVLAADLDADGDPDALSASYNDDKIAWYENTDGAGAFGPQRLISQAADGPLAISAADLDSDLVADVQSASFGDNEVAWYPNRDVPGTFDPQRLISTLGIGAISVTTADLDSDLDRDVVAASFSDDEIAWYENVDGRGFFGPQRLISSAADGAVSVFTADLDSDGDTDVLSASQNDARIAWYENADGFGGSWIARTISNTVAGASSVAAADLDSDGDADVLSAAQQDDTVAWYENVDGHGSLGPSTVVSRSGNGPVSVFAADVDGDGARDVLAASFSDSRIAWYQNLGGGNGFAPARVISAVASGAYSVFAADLDADGDTDVLSASQDDDKIAWYENLSGDCNGNGVPDGCDVGSGASGDCDADGIPDECQPDCNGNGVPDGCDLALGTSSDCDANGVPDECLPSRDCNENGIPDTCDGGCTACDADGDGCLDAADVAPGSPVSCGDTDDDGCDDCKSSVFDPAADGLDLDHDGFCIVGDCLPSNAQAWQAPGAASGLTIEKAAGPATLRWVAPAFRGAIFLRYDLLRSPAASDFFATGGAVCLETDGTDRTASDAAEPPPGAVLHYLVRVLNDCPGAGNLGTNSAGTPRAGRACP